MKLSLLWKACQNHRSSASQAFHRILLSPPRYTVLQSKYPDKTKKRTRQNYKQNMFAIIFYSVSFDTVWTVDKKVTNFLSFSHWILTHFSQGTPTKLASPTDFPQRWSHDAQFYPKGRKSGKKHCQILETRFAHAYWVTVTDLIN